MVVVFCLCADDFTFFLFSHVKQNDIDFEKDSQSDCWCRGVGRFHDGSRE